jgi:cob(I)alamin adenosyltransferase
MKIYTKTGDAGETGLYGGPRVAKDAPRIEAFGTVDELNASLGVVRTEPLPADVESLLARIQNQLFDLGALLATPKPTAAASAAIGPAVIAELETAIDQFGAELPPLRQFILPGGVPAAACLHVARTVCRRAERRVVSLARLPEENVAADLIVYLNRLGDLLFVLARFTNAAAGQADVPWVPRGS